MRDIFQILTSTPQKSWGHERQGNVKELSWVIEIKET